MRYRNTRIMIILFKKLNEQSSKKERKIKRAWERGGREVKRSESVCSVMQWRLFRPEQIRTALPEAAGRWLSLVCEYVCVFVWMWACVWDRVRSLYKCCLFHINGPFVLFLWNTLTHLYNSGTSNISEMRLFYTWGFTLYSYYFMFILYISKSQFSDSSFLNVTLFGYFYSYLTVNIFWLWAKQDIWRWNN